MGFSFSGAAPNQGSMFVAAEAVRRAHGRDIGAGGARPRAASSSHPGAIVVAFAPPSIPGLSRFGGFEFQVLDQTGTTSTRSRAALQACGARQQSPLLRGLFSTFTANDPQLQVDDRPQRALALGLPLGEITSAMQIFLGSQYVNDFEFNNRAYRVYVQADQQFRSIPQHSAALRAIAQPADGAARAGRQHRETTAPQVISHFNLFRSATINGSAAPGVSSGDALKEMERIATRTCRRAWATRGRASRSRKRRPAASRCHLRPRAAARVPHAGGAVREPRAAVHRAARRAARGAGRARRAVDARAVERRLLPGRSRHADRAGGEERDPDRRVRRAAARRGLSIVEAAIEAAASGCGRS
jgi:multidrug efflux pump subunit AcrB